MHLRQNSAPALRSRRKRKVSIVTSPSPLPVKTGRKQLAEEITEEEEDDETYQNQFEAVNEQKQVEESVTYTEEHNFQGIKLTVCDTDTLSLTKLCDETFSSCVVLPSSLWAMHVEHGGLFVAFSHLSEETSDVFLMNDKVVLLEADLVPKIFVRGMKIPALPSHFTNILLLSFRELNIFLQEAEALPICTGTGIKGINAYSEKCSLYHHKKQRGTRCMSCSSQRTRLRKTETQRQRRADARAGRAGGRGRKDPKTISLKLVYQESEEGDDELQKLGEADEGNEESDEENEETTYNET